MYYIFGYTIHSLFKDNESNQRYEDENVHVNTINEVALNLESKLNFFSLNVRTPI